MTGAGAGTGKGGMTDSSTKALGRLTQHDHQSGSASGLTRHRGLVALALVVLILAGWGVWELLG